MKKTEINRPNISIRMMIMVSFIILMLTTVGLIGYMVFSNWLSSAYETITEMAEDMNIEIYHQIDSYIHVPEYINEINQGLIENGIVNINNQTEREMFFVGVLKSHNSEAVYSFSYSAQ